MGSGFTNFLTEEIHVTTALSKIQHVTRPLPHDRGRVGGHVLVLNTGAIIGPESEAMLQALHSRSVGGIRAHLETLARTGADKFMSTFYVGYGHKSIGDLGTATVFIEGVSMLVAKAIQDWRLYAGQESSTRYIDFAEQTFLNPAGSDKGTLIQERWRQFYLDGVAEMKDVLARRYPQQPGEADGTYQKAINARVFDTMRAFLPAGATTNLAWHGNLRQFADEIALLRHHPLKEVRHVAITVEGALLEAFPNSFTTKRYKETERYNEEVMRNYYYDAPGTEFELTRVNISKTLLDEYGRVLSGRPPKTELPRQIAECGTLQFEFLLDFGSFRDIQRHRAVTQRMPILTTRHGFHPWYLGEQPELLRKKAEALLAIQEQDIKKLDLSPEEQQYYIAMGYQTANRLTGDLHALTYLVELRSTRFVHPTLRQRARQMAEKMHELFYDHGLVLHLDEDPDRFDVKRGEQDIVQVST